jgi:hypothetical protein
MIAALPSSSGVTDDLRPYDLFWMLHPSSLLKNLGMESFRILAGRFWSGAVELDVVFSPVVGCTLARGG